jgi:hypothetical protein
MSRVNQTCTSIAHFVPEDPQPTCSLPARGQGEQSRRPTLDQVEKREAATRAVRDLQREVELRKSLVNAINDAFLKLTMNLAELDGVVGAAGGIAAQANALLLPISSIWQLLTGLERIGRTHREAEAEGARLAASRGFAETFGRALDDPRLSPKQLTALAEDSKHVRHYAGLAVWVKDPHRRAHFGELVNRYLEGARAATKIVEHMTPAQRQASAIMLSRELSGTSSTSRLLDKLNVPK